MLHIQWLGIIADKTCPYIFKGAATVSAQPLVQRKMLSLLSQRASNSELCPREDTIFGRRAEV